MLGSDHVRIFPARMGIETTTQRSHSYELSCTLELEREVKEQTGIRRTQFKELLVSSSPGHFACTQGFSKGTSINSSMHSTDTCGGTSLLRKTQDRSPFLPSAALPNPTNSRNSPFSDPQAYSSTRIYQSFPVTFPASRIPSHQLPLSIYQSHSEASLKRGKAEGCAQLPKKDA